MQGWQSRHYSSIGSKGLKHHFIELSLVYLLRHFLTKVYTQVAIIGQMYTFAELYTQVVIILWLSCRLYTQVVIILYLITLHTQVAIFFFLFLWPLLCTCEVFSLFEHRFYKPFLSLYGSPWCTSSVFILWNQDLWTST